MIASDATRAFDALVPRLERAAAAIAVARARTAALARRGDPVRWRRAGLIWPLFGTE